MGTGGEYMGGYNLVTDRGYITSTPKSVNFPKKTWKWPNYERASCIPQPKFAERPYLAPSKTQFSGSNSALFWPIFNPS